MKRALIFLSVITYHLSLNAQHHSTCDSAIMVDKEVCGPVYADGKPDTRLALKDSTGIYFEKPHAVVWFTFVAPEDTILTFDLAPANKTDDIDFLLFKDVSGDFCKAMKSPKTRPLRSNIARCDKSLGGKTGLSLLGKHNYESPGNHPAYSKALAIKKGEHYYIAADNYSSANRPFTLYLHLRWPFTVPSVHDEKPLPAKPSLTVKVNIIIVDSTGHSVKTRLKIAGVSKKEIDTNHVSAYSLILQRRQKIKISCIAQGYLLNQSYLRAPLSGDTFVDTITLAPLKEHQNMVLQDIEFQPDQPAFLPEATEPLSNLLDFMQSNPNISILIKGYVNDPTHINSSKYDQSLSEDRAKAVLKYLGDRGISLKRMDWLGFGSRDMLYPNPQTIEEQQANRRVEIEVK